MVTMHFFYSVTCINVEIALGVTNLPKVGLDCIIKKKQRGDSQHSYWNVFLDRIVSQAADIFISLEKIEVS